MKRRFVHKMVSLDIETADLADKKSNFSSWVRSQLRSERNKRELSGDEQASINDNIIERYQKIETQTKIANRELLWHLEQRSPEEIKALVTILKNGFSDDETA